MVDLSRARPTEPDRTDEETGEDVYQVYRSYGVVEFRVPAGTVVRQQDIRWSNRSQSTDPRGEFPNMIVQDGALVLPVCDLVGVIVSRTDPAVLAHELWADDDVRTEFMECLQSTYSSLGDADRRKFLHSVQEVVHSTALDRAVSSLVSVEHDMRQKGMSHCRQDTYAQHYRNVLETVEALWGMAGRHEVTSRHGEAFAPPADSQDFEVGRRHWTESREYWRKKLLDMFAPPPDPPEEKKEDWLS